MTSSFTSFRGILLILATVLSFGFIVYTRHYYTYCSYGKLKGDYLVNQEVKELYSSLCFDVFKENDSNTNSNKSVMRFSLDMIYSLIAGITIEDENEYLKLKEWIKETGYYSIRFEMKILKIVHFLLYLVILYISVIWLPRLVLDFAVYLLDKILILIFAILILEALFNIYLDFNLDLVKIIQKFVNFLPINSVTGFIFNLLKEIGFMFLNNRGNIVDQLE